MAENVVAQYSRCGVHAQHTDRTAHIEANERSGYYKRSGHTEWSGRKERSDIHINKVL
jgi:hypothetical protein